MADELGDLLIPFIEAGTPEPHEMNAAVSIGRYYARYGSLTPALRATAWWLLTNHGIEAGERPAHHVNAVLLAVHPH